MRVFVDLIDAGTNVDDDGTVGDALARSGVYSFRRATNQGIEQLLISEHRKSTGSQGTKAAARDLRRFFRLLGFIGRDDQGAWSVGKSARTLLQLDSVADAPRLQELWREALIDIALEDEDGTSHP